MSESDRRATSSAETARESNPFSPLVCERSDGKGRLLAVYHFLTMVQISHLSCPPVKSLAAGPVHDQFPSEASTHVLNSILFVMPTSCLL